AQGRGLRRTDCGLVVHRRGGDSSNVLCAEDGVGRLEDPLWQLPMFVQAKDVQKGRKQRGPQGGELLPQRVEHFDPRRRLDRLLRRGDRQRHHLLVAVPDEEGPERLPELVRGERRSDRHALWQAARVAVVARCDLEILGQFYFVQQIE